MTSNPGDKPEFGTQSGHPTERDKAFRKMIGSVPLLMWKQMRAVCTSLSKDQTYTLRKAVEEACYAWIKLHWDRLPEDLQRENYYEGEAKLTARYSREQDDVA